MSNSVRPHRRQPTRLPRPWDSPGKNTGVGCHFLLQYVKVKSESEVAQWCPTLRDPMGCSLPGSSAHAIVFLELPPLIASPGFIFSIALLSLVFFYTIFGTLIHFCIFLCTENIIVIISFQFPNSFFDIFLFH